MIEGISLFQTMSQKLDFLGVRHTLLAQNVANADTPGYKAQDLKPFSEALRTVEPAGMMSTHHMHITSQQGNTTYREDRRVEGWEVEPSGNQISLEEQMIEAADGARQYELATSLMKKHVSMLKATLSTRA
ncbi:MAG: flagellar basal body rod protein FlgB [Pseudomonadota bacterium]